MITDLSPDFSHASMTDKTIAVQNHFDLSEFKSVFHIRYICECRQVGIFDLRSILFLLMGTIGHLYFLILIFVMYKGYIGKFSHCHIL